MVAAELAGARHEHLKLVDRMKMRGHGLVRAHLHQVALWLLAHHTLAAPADELGAPVFLRELSLRPLTLREHFLTGCCDHCSSSWPLAQAACMQSMAINRYRV